MRSAIESIMNLLPPKKKQYVPILLIHGGAGDITDSRAALKIEGLKAALKKSYPILLKDVEKGNAALNAVEAAVNCLEADENFNAGYGSVLNRDGNVEVEASIMNGRGMKAGCVCLLHDIKHPVSVARCIMEKTPHHFLGGEAAQQFAKANGFKELPKGSLVTKDAQAAYDDFRYRMGLKDDDPPVGKSELKTNDDRVSMGTVGAVAIDSHGNLAAATSTGGLTGKLPGRIGDTPLLGCGTYADNKVGAVSTTGHGETIMRYNLAQRIMSKIELLSISAQEATELSLKEMTGQFVGTGGVIAIDAVGDVGIFWTSERMAWAYIREGKMIFGVNPDESAWQPYP